jgi:DNA mismatch repair ATPase MutS
VPENVLVIEGGRHPLAELVVDSYIPNSTHMDDEGSRRVHMITGDVNAHKIRPGLCS